MGGERASKIPAPKPKTTVPPNTAITPAEPVRPPVTPGYAGRPGGNALDAIERAKRGPAPTAQTVGTPRRPDPVRNAAIDYAQDVFVAAAPLIAMAADVGPRAHSISDLAAIATIIELKGRPMFDPSFFVGRYIQGAGAAGALLRVRYANLASGKIVIQFDGCAYQAEKQWLRIRNADLVPRDRANELGLVVWMVDNVFYGYIATANAAKSPGDPALIDDEGIFKTVFGRSYHGPDSLYLSSWENALADGELRMVGAYDLHPPDGPTLTGLFSLIDEDFRFMSHGTLAVEGAEVDQVTVTRTPGGILQAMPNLRFNDKWTRHGFTAGFDASFFDGSFEARGRVELKYPNEKGKQPYIQGVVNVVATTPEKAWAAANANDPNPQVTGGISRTNVTDRGLALVAWGRLDLLLAPGSPKVDDKKETSPLNATAMFLVDPAGDITARGILRMPRTYELIPPYKTKKIDLIPPITHVMVGGEIWGPFGAEVRTFATVTAFANVGPVSLRDLIAEGTYSTREGVGSQIKLEGSFNASAEAHVEAQVGVEVRATVGVHLPWPLPDITAGQRLAEMHFSGDASLKGYVDARPEIRRDGGKVETEPPMYSIHGRIDVAGELLVKLGMGGSIGIPGFQQSGNFGKTIRLASGGFHVKLDHEFGSDAMPKVTYDKIKFDPQKFVKAAKDPTTKAVTDKKIHGKFDEDERRGEKQKPNVPISATEPPPQPALPDRPFELHVASEIGKNHHHDFYLSIKPDNKSTLEMASVREAVMAKLDRALEFVRQKLGYVSSGDEYALLRRQLSELEELEADVLGLLSEANAMAAEIEYLHRADLPEFDDIVEALAEYGERYGDEDIEGASRLLTSGYEVTEVEATEPERYRYLGAARIGNSNYFEGDFDDDSEYGWRWGPDKSHPGIREWPTGDVTRHPINEALGLHEATRLDDLKPSGPFRTNDKKTTGAAAIESELYDWRIQLDTRAAELRDEILNKENVTRGEAMRRAKRQIEQEYVDRGYPDHPFHVLKVIGVTTWYCHHVHEVSWGGGDEKSNLIYLVLDNEHQRITDWFENRRDDIELHLEIPKRRQRKTP